jgi:hypothetical protein
MADVPYAVEKRTSYENFDARCPRCGFFCRFNRASDLNDFNPIDFKEVRCLSPDCDESFNINGDSINSPHEMLIYDCYDLKKEKRYCYCILNLAQAFEAFFSLYLRVSLLYKPFARHNHLDQLNRMAAALYEAIKKYPYAKLRNLFLNCVLANQEVTSLNQAELVIRNVSNSCHEPSDQLIAQFPNQEIADLLRRLKYSGVAELRNKVVHQHAYRPTLAEVDSALEETRSILFPLGSLLNVEGDDINWYLRPA